MLAPSVSAAIRARSHGVRAGPWIPAASASAIACSTASAGRVEGHRGGRRHRGADEDPRAEPEPEVGRDQARRRRLVGHRDRRARRRSRRNRSPGTSAWPTATTGHAPGLEVLEGERQVEDRLRPGAHDGDRRPGELLEVRRDVEAGCPAAREPSAPWWTPPMPPVAKTRIPAASAAIIVAETVVAAQPSRASAAARFGRAALRTEPAGAVPSDSRSSGPRPDQHPPVADRDRRRDRAARADGRLGRPGDRDVLGIRQAVADERRLEGDDRPARGEGGARPRAPGRSGRRSSSSPERSAGRPLVASWPGRGRRPSRVRAASRRAIGSSELELRARRAHLPGGGPVPGERGPAERHRRRPADGPRRRATRRGTRRRTRRRPRSCRPRRPAGSRRRSG